MLAEACMVFDAVPVRNYVSWAALFTGYACCGRVAEARELMPERNDVSWNMMILGKLFPPLLFRRRSFEGTFPRLFKNYPNRYENFKKKIDNIYTIFIYHFHKILGSILTYTSRYKKDK